MRATHAQRKEFRSEGHALSSLHPPSFNEALTTRQQARAAGLDPDHWYPVLSLDALAPGAVTTVKFWYQSIALYRSREGTIHAVEDRCAHRGVRLSLGEVDGDCLVCPYHGWSYDGTGRLTKIPHSLFDKPMPNCKVRAYTVQIRYGLIWLFPGTPEAAAHTPVPSIPELDGPNPWASAAIDFTCNCHHSIVAENINDFTHEHLHRKFKPFIAAQLKSFEATEDRVFISYLARTGQGRISSHFVDRSRFSTDQTDLCYEYPHHSANTGGRIKSWAFLLPIDRQTTHVFFRFYFDALKIPLLPGRAPRWLQQLIITIGKHLTIRPILNQDITAMEAEQQGYESGWSNPAVELNPVIGLLQRLTVRKWRRVIERFPDMDNHLG